MRLINIWEPGTQKLRVAIEFALQSNLGGFGHSKNTYKWGIGRMVGHNSFKKKEIRCNSKLMLIIKKLGKKSLEKLQFMS